LSQLTTKDLTREKIITAKNNQLHQELLGSFTEDQFEYKQETVKQYPKVLPAIKSGTTKANDLIASAVTDNATRHAFGGDQPRTGDPYNNTMVEFGSIRQS